MPLTSPSPLVHSYAVDFLVAERRVGKRRQYRVRWVGYGVADDTWEDARSVLTPVLIENFERVRDCGGLAAAVREQAHRLRLSSAHLATRAGVEASEWLAREGVIEATELPAAFELTSESVSDACGIPDGVERALREWLETSWTRDRVAAEALPPGWTEEERVTCTDRTYYVYHGPEGERASSRSAAWRIATEVPDAMEDPTSAAIAELASSLEAWGGSRALTQSITQHWTAVAYMRPDNGRPYHIFVSPDGKRLRSRTAVAKHLGLSTHSTAPPSGSAASAGAAPATGRPLPSSTWVECDRCKKWRRLPFASARQVLPRVWLCEMNPDPLHDACEYEEEREEDPAEEDLAADAERSDDDDEAAGGGVLGASPEETSPPNVSHAGGDAHGARKRPREDETRGRHTPPAGCYPPAVCASQYARPRPCCPPLTAPDRPRPPPTAPSGLEWPRVALNCHLPSLLDAPSSELCPTLSTLDAPLDPAGTLRSTACTASTAPRGASRCRYRRASAGPTTGSMSTQRSPRASGRHRAGGSRRSCRPSCRRRYRRRYRRPPAETAGTAGAASRYAATASSSTRLNAPRESKTAGPPHRTWRSTRSSCDGSSII